MKVSKGLVYRMVTTMVEDRALQEKLIQSLGVQPSPRQHPLDETVPVARLNEAHHRLATLTGDEFVSWRFGYRFELDTLGVLGYLWKHSATLEDMIEHHVNFLGLLMDVVSATFDPVAGGRKIEWTPVALWEQQDRVAVQREHEAAVGFFCKAIQVMTGEAIKPKAIALQRSRPAPYPASFGKYIDLVRFEQEKHAITFHDRDLKRPLVSYNPHVLKTLKSYAAELLTTLQTAQDLPTQVEQSLIRGFSGTFLQIHEVAEEFNMSARNLQRKLSEAGTSFRDILNRVKLNLAQVYLKDSALSVSEVAFILGYAELPAFIRFFRRHKGISPGDFRR